MEATRSTLKHSGEKRFLFYRQAFFQETRGVQNRQEGGARRLRLVHIPCDLPCRRTTLKNIPKGSRGFSERCACHFGGRISEDDRCSSAASYRVLILNSFFAIF